MLVSGVVAGFILGLASGGDWRRLTRLDLKFLPALVVAAALRAVAPFLSELSLGASMFGLALIAVVALMNRALPGAWLVALGSTLNLLVISINGGMPVEPEAMITAGKSFPNDGLHVLLGPTTHLGFLADVLLAPIVNNVYSVGDVLLAAGGFWMAFRVLR
jgi:hypothetical protein